MPPPCKPGTLVLLGMSGVRVRDPELLKLGLTLPGFVERSRVIASLPSLGLLTLAAHTPPPWTPVYRECGDSTEETVREVLREEPSLVAISSLTARIDDAYAVADALRGEGIPVVLGGLHATALPEEVAEHADAVVVGEGEPVWEGLLDDAAAGTLRRLYRSVAPFAFRDARVPRYGLLDPARYNRLTLQTTRGCPMGCHFCAASRILSPFKTKPLDRVRAELDAIHAVWPDPFIELADDNTFVDRRWSRELLGLFASQCFRWFTESDISIADDPELLDLLGAARCAQVLVGLEASNPAAALTVDPAGWKARRFDRYREAVGRIQSHGVPVNGCFILGHDTDGEEVFGETLALIDSLDLAEVQITLLTPFPGSGLHRDLARQGRLLEERFWNRCTLFDVTYRPARMGVEALEKGFRHLMREVYSDARVARRRQVFRHTLRHPPSP